MRVDWPRVRERVVGIIEQTSAGTERGLRATEGLDVYHAYARFEGRRGKHYQVRVGDELIEAMQVFINTGTRALIPEVEGIGDVPWLDSERLLRLDTLPEHLIVLGGSYIGMELGQAFRRLGNRVTVIQPRPA